MAFGVLGLGRGLRDQSITGLARLEQIERQNDLAEERMKAQQDAVRGQNMGTLGGMGLYDDMNSGRVSFGSSQPQVVSPDIASKVAETQAPQAGAAGAGAGLGASAGTAVPATGQIGAGIWNASTPAATAAELSAANAAAAGSTAGAGTGAQTGATFGPWGALVGLAAGYLISSLF